MAKTNRKVGLEGIRFVSPIGFFEEERILKNEFKVDVAVSFDTDTLQKDLDNLDHTVDYSELFNICDFYFRKEFKLIESVAHNILEDIKLKYPFVQTINIKIIKLNPPIKAEIKNSFIELNYFK